MSSASLLALLTTNRQLVLQLGSTILTSRNEWLLIGDWRFLLYNQDTYGLSTGTPLNVDVVLGLGLGEHHPHRRRPADEVQPPALPPGRAPERLGQPLRRRRRPDRPVLRHRGRVARPRRAVPGHHEPLRLQHLLRIQPGRVHALRRHAERRLRQPGLDHQRLPGDLRPARPGRLPHLAGEHPGEHDGRRRLPRLPGALRHGAPERARLLAARERCHERGAALPDPAVGGLGRRGNDRPRLRPGALPRPRGGLRARPSGASGSPTTVSSGAPSSRTP